MPIHATLEPEGRYWTLGTDGVLSLSELETFIHRHEWKDVRDMLWDLRDLREAPDTTEEMRAAAALAGTVQELLAGSRVAIVVSRDFEYGMARMFQAFTDDHPIDYRAFRDLDDATGFLTSEAASRT